MEVCAGFERRRPFKFGMAQKFAGLREKPDKRGF